MNECTLTVKCSMLIITFWLFHNKTIFWRSCTKCTTFSIKNLQPSEQCFNHFFYHHLLVWVSSYNLTIRFSRHAFIFWLPSILLFLTRKTQFQYEKPLKNHWCVVDMNLNLSLRLTSCSAVQSMHRLVNLENIRKANKGNVGQTRLSAPLVTPAA